MLFGFGMVVVADGSTVRSGDILEADGLFHAKPQRRNCGPGEKFGTNEIAKSSGVERYEGGNPGGAGTWVLLVPRR